MRDKRKRSLKYSPIGVFDSGVGGLSVLREIWELLPAEETIYIADQAHVPYGSRTLDQVQRFSEQITSYLLTRGAKLIVVACNTASAAALHHLRSTFPHTPFVGMEPAVKPAAEQTHSGVVGVLATPATFQGTLYASVVDRFANGVELLQNTCPGLVDQIEQGRLQDLETRKILQDALVPMLDRNIDTVVLGCTHYPFVIPAIQEIIGPAVHVIDPAPAVARQAQRILTKFNLLRPPDEDNKNLVDTLHTFLTSGNPDKFAALAARLLDCHVPVQSIRWKENFLT